MRWYVYGLTDDATSPPTRTGVGGATVELVGDGALRLLASVAPGDIDELVRAEPEQVVAAVVTHDDVLVELARDRTVLPARFGTIVADDDVRALLADEDGALTRQLERVADAQEWVVAVGPATARTGEDAGADLSPGHAFFARRQAEADARAEARARAVETAERLDTELRRVARDVASLPLRDDLVARGAYLVPTDAAATVREQVEAAARHAPVELQGPLPPYHFTEVG